MRDRSQHRSAIGQSGSWVKIMNDFLYSENKEPGISHITIDISHVECTQGVQNSEFIGTTPQLSTRGLLQDLLSDIKHARY